MSVLETEIVDAVGTEVASGKIVLTISDHLAWNDQNHLALLQDKLNAYLRFIESGELEEEYPNARGRAIAVDIVCRLPPDEPGIEFVRRIKECLEPLGYEIRCRTLGTSRS